MATAPVAAAGTTALLLLSSLLVAQLPAMASAAGPAAPEPGQPMQMVSMYHWLPGTGQEDVLRALTGFMNISRAVPAARTLTAGADLGLADLGAYDFSATLATPEHEALLAYYASEERLFNTIYNTHPITAEHHTIVYQSDRIRLEPPPVGYVRHACIFAFHEHVMEYQKEQALKEMEEVLAAAPRVVHFSCGRDIAAEDGGEEYTEGRLALVADFASIDDFDTFYHDTARLDFLNRLDRHLATHPVCVDYQVPDMQAKDPRAYLPPSTRVPGIEASFPAHVGPVSPLEAPPSPTIVHVDRAVNGGSNRLRGRRV